MTTPLSRAPNYEDAALARYFPHIDLYLNERGFDGIWRVRAGVQRQTADTWPVNYYAEGITMTAAILNMRTVLLNAMATDDLNNPRWRVSV